MKNLSNTIVWCATQLLFSGLVQMQQYSKIGATLLAILVFFSCAKDDQDHWLIPLQEVIDGGVGKDGIPALTDPASTLATQVTFLDDEDLVLGIEHEGEIFAVPHEILDWHEIVNLSLGNTAVTYCPLSGSGFGVSRAIRSQITTFGVSGYLYDNNLIAFDRLTESNWSQMKMLCVNGELSSTEFEFKALLQMKWSSWISMFPNSQVVNRNTGYTRDYGEYPYGNYKTNPDYIIYPMSRDDDRLNRKEMVYGVNIAGHSRAYRITSFSTDPGLIHDELGGVKLILIGSQPGQYITAFERVLQDGTELNFTEVWDGDAVVMEDQEGTQWDVLGRGISGPRAGQRLTPVKGFMAYWFAFGTFYPDIEIYE